MYLKRFKFTKCTDGLSKTLMVGEVVDGHTRDSSNIWTRGLRNLDSFRTTANPLNTWPGTGVIDTGSGTKVNGAFASRHPGGCQFVFGDGHVAMLNESIDQDIYEALSTRDMTLWPYTDRREPMPSDY